MSTRGILPVTSIPNWPTPPHGVMEGLASAMQAAGIEGTVFISPDGLHVPHVTTAQNFLSAYAGSATHLSYLKTKKQVALDALLDANLDLAKFIRGGTVTTVTAANVGNFLAQITNNYRSLRASILGAADMTTLSAININTGWPAKP